MVDRGQSVEKARTVRGLRSFTKVVGAILASLAIGLLWLSPVQAGSSRTYSAEELAFVAQLNHYRTSNGERALELSDTLSLAAERHSLDMAYHSFISHTTDTRDSEWFQAGSYPWDRMQTCGYEYDTRMGENIGAGQSNADALFEGFKASKDHNMVMLHDELSVIGISFEEISGSDCTYYWTADFGGYVDESAQGFSVYEEDDSDIGYLGSWMETTDSESSGGAHSFLDAEGSLTVRFSGTSLSWIAWKSKDSGIVKVTLDQYEPIYVDLFSSSREQQRCVYSTGTLPEGHHSLVVEWTGTHNPDSTGTAITVDALDVQGSLSSPEGRSFLADVLRRYLRVAMAEGGPSV